VSRKSDDGHTTIYSPEERLLALLIAPVLVGLALLGQSVFGDFLAWKIVGFIIGFGVLSCLWIGFVGRTSDD
jgi:hypothetical protein